VLVPPTRVGLPNRDAGAIAPPRRRFWRPVCSEDRRARVEGPSEGRVCRAHATISRACVGCMSFVAHARRRSPPRRPPDIRCHRRAAVAGGYPLQTTDRPRPSFRRRPAKRAAFQKTRMPLTATTREGVIAKGLLPSALTPALSLTPPTLCPQKGTSAFDGHCKVTVRSPAGP
jgi:hypothetical protein